MRTALVLWMGAAWVVSAAAEAADPPALPQDETALQAVLQKASVDLDALKARLSRTRDRIASERKDKENELAGLENGLVLLRQACDGQTALAAALETEQRTASEAAERLERETVAVRASLEEIRRSAETAYSVLDRAVFRAELDRADAALNQAGGDAALASCCRDVFALIVGQAMAGTAVRRFEGRAVGETGEEVSGMFIQAGGGVALFTASAADGPAGVVRLEHGSVRPHVAGLPDPADRQALRAFAGGRAVPVPLDVTGGNAVKSRQAEWTPMQTFRAGGAVMYPIAGVAVVGLFLAVWKAVGLWRIPVPEVSRLREFAKALYSDRVVAGHLAENAKGPLRRLLREAVACADTPRERLEEILRDAVLAEVPALESKLGAIAVGVAVAPLLGLLGTVTGMIHTFRLISLFGTGDARMLSGGISEALVTTEAGLTVAIPLLLLHALLSRRAKKLTDGLENGASAILDAVPDGRSPSEKAVSE